MSSDREERDSNEEDVKSNQMYSLLISYVDRIKMSNIKAKKQESKESQFPGENRSTVSRCRHSGFLGRNGPTGMMEDTGHPGLFTSQ